MYKWSPKNGPKIGGSAPFLGRVAGSPSSTMWPGPRLTMPSAILIHPAVWPQYTWTEKWGGSCAPLGEGEVGPHLIQCGQGRGLHACQLAKFHLYSSNHLAAIHQRHRDTDKTRQLKTDMTRRRTDSIWRTVLQTVVLKVCKTVVFEWNAFGEYINLPALNI